MNLIGRLVWWLLAMVGFRAPTGCVLDEVELMLAREML